MKKITNFKLRKNLKNRLLEFFVLEVMPRSTADLLEIYPNTGCTFLKENSTNYCFSFAK